MVSKPERKIASPQPTVETARYWEAAAAGRLLVPHCIACGEKHWYPRAHCPFCFGTAIEPREASGDGVIYSYSVMRRAPEPYVIAYVTLAEGPVMLTNIVECDPDRVAIGEAVRLCFKPSEDGQPVPMFRPA